MKKLLTALMLCFSLFAQAEITMSQLTAEEQTSTSYTIGKIVLEDGYLYLVAPNGEVLGSDLIANVRSIVFEGSASSINNVTSSSLYIYPTITNDAINVVGAEDAVKRIYGLDGNLLMTTQENQINVSGLPNGSYLIQVNTQIVKFIKN